MKKFLAFIDLLVHQALGAEPRQARPAGEAASSSAARHCLDPLREKIAKFKAQAREFDRLHCPGLAQGYDESAKLLERELRLRDFAKAPDSTRRAA
jgi:hypothetical protein